MATIRLTSNRADWELTSPAVTPLALASGAPEAQHEARPLILASGVQWEETREEHDPSQLPH